MKYNLQEGWGKLIKEKTPLPATAVRVYDEDGNLCSFWEFETEEEEEFELACTRNQEAEKASLISSFNSEGTCEVVSQCHLPDQVQTPANWARACPSTSTPLASKQAFVGVDLLDCEEDPIEEDGQVILNENEDMALDLRNTEVAELN